MKYIETSYERRNIYNKRYLEHMLEVIKADGSSPELENPVGFREVLWHCFPLFEAGGEYAKRANSIIRQTEFKRCHFMPMNFTQLLVRYGELIEEDVKAKLKAYIIDILPFSSETEYTFQCITIILPEWRYIQCLLQASCLICLNTLNEDWKN